MEGSKPVKTERIWNGLIHVAEAIAGNDCISYSIILIYIQQDATLHSLFYVETALHFSGGTATHNQERKQLNIQHLVFVTPLLLPAAIAADIY